MQVETKPAAPRQLMGAWLDALKSGDYAQGKHAMCIGYRGQEKLEYCCLGVADEVCFGAVFSHTYHSTLADDEGNHTRLSSRRTHALALDMPVTIDEVEAANALVPHLEHPLTRSTRVGITVPRIAVLSALNDSGVDFAGIADYIERMAWDK